MQKIFFRIVLGVILIVGSVLASSFVKMDETADKYEPVVVLELFTSQGCSSCPAADALLNTVKHEFTNQNVFALSYHVAYWNYIGWKDPFSKEIYADKQRVYAQKFNSSSIYTPQLVVNGREHFVGSNRNTMYSKLKAYLKAPTTNAVDINSVNRNGNQVDFQYGVKGSTTGKNIRFALVINERETSVKRGENRNRKLKNTNIVVNQKITPLTKAQGSQSLMIPAVVNENDDLQLIVIVEDVNYSTTGAAKSAL